MKLSPKAQLLNGMTRTHPMQLSALLKGWKPGPVEANPPMTILHVRNDN